MTPVPGVHTSDTAAATDDVPGDVFLHAAWLAGDDRAGERLLARVRPAVSRYLQSKAPLDAQDVLQATLERAHRVRAKYSGRGRFEGFMILVARNVLRETRRRASSRPVASASPSGLDVRGSEESPARLAESAELRQRVREAIDRLPADQRAVVEAYFHGGLRVPEIADRLGLPLGTVKSRKAAGLLKIREYLEASGATRRQIRLTLAESGLDES